MRREDFFISKIFFIMISGSIFAFFIEDWRSMYLIQLLLLLSIGNFILRDGSRLILRLVTFGLFAGFVELLADFILVEKFQTLVYLSSDPRILSSPIYMPFAWMEVILTHGYIILRLREKFSEKASAFLGALVAGLTIGFYETIAYHAKWWMYLKASFFLFNTPLFIPFGEFLIFLGFLFWWRRRFGGFFFGLSIAIWYSLAWYFLSLF